MSHSKLFMTMSLLVLAAGSVTAEVRFAPSLERGPGAGYNGTHYDKRVRQPKSILKNSPANRRVHSERRFTQRLGAQTRQTMRHRGDVARHARRSGQVKATLNRQGRAVRFDTSPRRGGAGYNNKRYDRRVAKPKSILKGSPANRVVKAERRFTRKLGSQTRGVMTHRGQVARHARVGRHARHGGKAVKHGRNLRTVGKVAAGGVVVAGGIYAAEQTLGVDIPDVVDVGEWTYGTLKDPKNAGRRFDKLGRDAAREVESGARTLTNPKKMARNIENSVNKTGKSIGKAGCKVGKLFGAKC